MFFLLPQIEKHVFTIKVKEGFDDIEGGRKTGWTKLQVAIKILVKVTTQEIRHLKA
jgi:hypothetical protein